MLKQNSPSQPRRRATAWTAALAVAMLSALPVSADNSASPPADSDAAKAAADALPAGVVNLNSADEKELARLPGIGPSKAQAIVALRDRMKGFKRVEDIMRVKGIGRKTFRKLRPMLTLEGATTLATATKTKRR